MIWIILTILGFIAYSWNEDRLRKRNLEKYNSYVNRNLNLSRSKLNEKKVDISEIKLSDEQQKLFDKIENTHNHIFITGKAGTGKSVLLQYLKSHSSKRLVVAAPTGVAALNVGGQTIHSLFKIPPQFISKNSLRVNYKTATLLRNLDMVVIDEISMVRADLMDAIGDLLKQARGNNLPFGGVQMVTFGDLYQLPPVVSDSELHKYFANNYGGYYFFHADSWKNTPLDIYELRHIFRQSDENFKEILNSIRTGDLSDTLLIQLNQRAAFSVPESGVITLATTNQTVHEINHYRLSQLDGKQFEYKATIVGDLEKSSFPTEEILCLKEGAQVMLLKNDREKRWVNGTIGYIHSLSYNEIKINIDGNVYSVPQETWSKINYYYDRENNRIEEDVVSSFTQYPLRLAWAITVNKAQGQTYGSVVVDMGGGAFAHGQTYVALSRCKNLDGLYLKREICREDILIDQTIINFMERATILES